MIKRVNRLNIVEHYNNKKRKIYYGNKQRENKLNQKKEKIKMQYGNQLRSNKYKKINYYNKFK